MEKKTGQGKGIRNLGGFIILNRVSMVSLLRRWCLSKDLKARGGKGEEGSLDIWGKSKSTGSGAWVYPTFSKKARRSVLLELREQCENRRKWLGTNQAELLPWMKWRTNRKCSAEQGHDLRRERTDLAAKFRLGCAGAGGIREARIINHKGEKVVT